MNEVEAVKAAIKLASCPGREGPFGGYDYGHNEAFYGPAPEDGRYVIRDFRDPKSPDWGKWLHQTDNREEHEAMFVKMTDDHIAQAAIAALDAARGDAEPVAWRYVRKPDEWPPANPVVQSTRWLPDDPARPFWIEQPLYAHPTRGDQVARNMSSARWKKPGSSRRLCGMRSMLTPEQRAAGWIEHDGGMSASQSAQFWRNNMASELKPCPFCNGTKARVIHIRDGRKVACICGACGRPEFNGPLDIPSAEQRAIAAWNTCDQTALDEARAEGAAAERAKVVAWLRGGAGTDTTQLPRSTRALFLRGLHGYADAIEQGAHHDPE